MGAGRISTFVHLENVLSNRRLNLQWITEDNPANVEVCKEHHHIHDVPFYPSKDVPDLLSKKDLDAVLIFVPTELHCHYICESMKKGKAVFVEKPLGSSRSVIEKCFDHSEKYGLPLVTAFNKRFDSGYRNAIMAAKDKSFGGIHIVTIASKDSPKPTYEFLRTCDKTPCNIFADMCVHDIDMMVWLTNAERPESIYLTAAFHDPVMAKFGQPDTLAVVLKYKSGIVATLTTSRFAAYGYDMRMEIFGPTGMVCVENPRVSPDVRYDKTGSHARRLYESFGPRFKDSYVNELNHFIDCVEGKDKPLITREESLMVAEIIEKGLESYREKKIVYF